MDTLYYRAQEMDLPLTIPQNQLSIRAKPLLYLIYIYSCVYVWFVWDNNSVILVGRTVCYMIHSRM